MIVKSAIPVYSLVNDIEWEELTVSSPIIHEHRYLLPDSDPSHSQTLSLISLLKSQNLTTFNLTKKKLTL